MGQSAGGLKTGIARVQRDMNRGTQRTVHVGRQFGIGTLFARSDHFHAPRTGTNHLSFGGVQNGRRNGHANEQSKPNKNKSCKESMCARFEHTEYYVRNKKRPPHSGWPRSENLKLYWPKVEKLGCDDCIKPLFL
jgi:hypothetical protein